MTKYGVEKHIYESIAGAVVDKFRHDNINLYSMDDIESIIDELEKDLTEGIDQNASYMFGGHTEVIDDLEIDYINEIEEIEHKIKPSQYGTLQEIYANSLIYACSYTMMHEILSNLKQGMYDLTSLMESKPNAAKKFFVDSESMYGWCSHSSEYDYGSLYVYDWSNNQIENEFSGIEATIKNTNIILISSYTV